MIDIQTQSPITPPPAPKYWVGESIVFDRRKTDYAGDDEKVAIDRITEITIGIGGQRNTWEVLYYVNEYDDAVPEECILGPCVAGLPR